MAATGAAAVGYAVRLIVGADVAVTEGLAEGCRLGGAVGFVGAAVGSFEGRIVGAVVGSALGIRDSWQENTCEPFMGTYTAVGNGVVEVDGGGCRNGGTYSPSSSASPTTGSMSHVVGSGTGTRMPAQLGMLSLALL